MFSKRNIIQLKKGIAKMKKGKCNMETNWKRLISGVLPAVLFLFSYIGQICAQDTISAGLVLPAPVVTETPMKLFGGEVTNKGVGGVAVKFSSFNDQFALMTGGRGAITINKKFTIGGDGYGIANTIQITSPGPDTTRNFKMGYGGLELGYVFYPGKKVNFGATMLFAAGASFWQNNPKSLNEELFDEDFKMFPVFEPSIYGEFAVSQIMRLHTGVSYRYIAGADLDYITVKKMRGFSGYVALMFGRW